MPDVGNGFDLQVWAIEDVGERKRMVVGSLRCEVTPDQVILADDRFGFPILGAARVGQGWLFVAADGAVARADSFLGPLEPLGQVPRPYWISEWAVSTLQVSDGRLAFPTQDPRASLWTTDGSAPIAPARGTPPGIVQSAAFVDAAHGMIVVDGGQLYVTRDGAASFERVDLGLEAAATVTADHGALRVATSSGIVVFDRDGTVKARGGSGPTPGSTHLEPSQHASLFRRLFVEVVRRYGALVAESFGWVVAPDGRVLVPIEHGLKPLSEVAPAAIAAFHHTRHCRATRWGKDYAVSCIGEDGFHVDATTLQGTLVSVESGDSETTFFEDGVHAAWVHHVGRSGAELCIAPDRGAPCRPLLPPPPAQRMIGSHGNEVVLLQPAASTLVLVDASTGSERSLSVRLPSEAAELPGHDWRLSADGAFAFVEARHARAGAADERWVVRVALSDGTMTTEPLPGGATRAGFVNANLGVAADDEAHRVWVTDDGGSRWHAHAGVHGYAWLPRRLRPREAASEWNLPVKCGGHRCVIEEIVVSFGPSSPVPTDRMLALPAAPSGPERTDAARPPGNPAALACATQDTAWPARASEQVRDDAVWQFHEPNVNATLRVDGRRWEAEWLGTDSLGRYGARHSAGKIVDPRADKDSDEYELRSASREGVVVSITQVWRPGRDGQTPGFRLIWMPAGGRARMVSARANAVVLEDTLALPDGRLALLIGLGEPSARSYEARYHELVLVDRTRGVIARRTYAWYYRNVGIGFFDGTVGVQWAESDPTSPHWFLPISGAPAIPERAKLDLVSTPICSPRSRTSVVAIAVENVWAFEERRPEYPIARAYVRDEGHACIQSVELRDPRLTGRDLFLVASPGGELITGFDLADTDTRREMRCAIEAAPEQDITALGHADLQSAWSEYR